MKYLLDTCIFNWIRNGTHTVFDLPEGRYLVTHIQRDEIGNDPDEARRAELLKVFEEQADEQIPTGVFAVGVSRLGQAALGGGEIYHRICTELTAKNKRKRKHQSNIGDAIIGATAHAMKVGLVTADADFFQVMKGILQKDHLVLWRKQ